MTTPAELRPKDIAEQLRAIMRRRGGERPVALWGTGQAGKVDLDGNIWDVVPVRGELELRARLAETVHDTAVVFLVSSDDRLPLDVACRLVGQRVHHVDRATRLASRFGARKVAPGLAATTLAAVLLDDGPEVGKISGTLLQLDDAWKRYLVCRGVLSDPTETPTVLSLLRSGLRAPEVGPAFPRVNEEYRDGLLREAASWMRRVAGPAGEEVWSCWIAGSISELVGWCIHIDAARRCGDTAAAHTLRTALRYAPSAREEWLGEASLAEPLCEALDALLTNLPAGDLRKILDAAEGLFSDPDFGAARRASPWLPEGFRGLQEELAGALVQAADDPGALPRVYDIFDALERHHQRGADGGAERHHEVRTAGVRLVTWLAWFARRPPAEESGWGDVPVLSQWYDTEGGWVDWARDELRSHTTGHAELDGALRTILEKADEARRRLDERFAHGVIAWHGAGKPTADVLPVEQVTQKVVAEFLAGEPTRKLLVVLLDGMSVSVATRLLQARDRWAPVLWTPPRRRAMPPAIASLPTLTTTSRAAFFAGKPQTDVSIGKTERNDPKRFAANKALAAFADARQGPRLFPKSELGGAGQLSPALLMALRDDDERVVGVIVNAIDDQLKGSDQVALNYDRPQSIPTLDRLFDAAGQTERAVLLVSDHGHIPAQTLGRAVKPPATAPDSGQRWRGLAAGESAQAGEVELPLGCWRPKGAEKVAVFWDETRVWTDARSGAHGGISLAEAVIPLRLMAPEWLYDTLVPPDEGLRTRPQEAPGWWALQLPPAARPVRAAPKPKPPPPGQGSLFALPQPPPKPAPVPAVEAVRHPLAEKLEGADLFKARSLGQPEDKVALALRLVDVLLKAPGCAMSREACARALGIKTRRLASRVAHIGFLNADGFTVIEDDITGAQIRLHVDRLTSQYGL